MSKLKSIELHGNLQSSTFEGASAETGFMISKNGDAILNSLKIREYLEVDELKYNKISVFDEEQWIAPAAKILEVSEKLSNNNYIVTFDVEDNGGIIAFEKNDILKGIFCNFTEDGPGTKVYAQYYFEVIENTQINANQAELRPIQRIYETEITNNPTPIRKMVLVRIGNFVNKKRQRSIMISSKDGCIKFLDGVNKPTIENKNIKMILGDTSTYTPDWIKDYAIDGQYSAILENVIIKGKFFQVSNVDGDSAEVPSYEGIFNVNTRYFKNNTVSYDGSIYIMNNSYLSNENAPYPYPNIDTSHWSLYISKGDEGISVIAKYGATYETEDWHEDFRVGDNFMQQFNQYGQKIGNPVRIVGEKGDGSDYFDFSFARTAVADVNPDTFFNENDWQDAPPSLNANKSNKYLWCRMQRMLWNPSVEGNYAKDGNPTYTLMSADSYYIVNATNDNCTINEIILSDSNKLREHTLNNIELFRDNIRLDLSKYDISVSEESNCTVTLNRETKTVYINKINDKNSPVFYKVKAFIQGSIEYEIKCTCSVALTGEDGIVADVYELYPSTSNIRYNYDGTIVPNTLFNLKVKKFNDTTTILHTIEDITSEGIVLK
ncbi:MAG: hypothetical protein RSF67_04625, partial [Clostridia bacterium]